MSRSGKSPLLRSASGRSYEGQAQPLGTWAHGTKSPPPSLLVRSELPPSPRLRRTGRRAGQPLLEKRGASGTLFVIATPIGNLGDITQRALDTLRSVDAVLAEDTRVTKRLLERYGIQKSIRPLHQHSLPTVIRSLVEEMRQGQTFALVTDAGTPGISDPGRQLVAAAWEAGLTVSPLPGPSALAAAASISGLPTDEFLFLGFLPHKKGRQTLIKEIAASERTVILYESTHRIEKLLRELAAVLGNGRTVVVCRELTKQFEHVYRGSAVEVLRQLREDKVKGEFVVLVAGA